MRPKCKYKFSNRLFNLIEMTHRNKKAESDSVKSS